MEGSMQRERPLSIGQEKRKMYDFELQSLCRSEIQARIVVLTNMLYIHLTLLFLFHISEISLAEQAPSRPIAEHGNAKNSLPVSPSTHAPPNLLALISKGHCEICSDGSFGSTVSPDRY
jgi:hypothetical protein